MRNYHHFYPIILRNGRKGILPKIVFEVSIIMLLNSKYRKKKKKERKVKENDTSITLMDIEGKLFRKIL